MSSADQPQTLEEQATLPAARNEELLQRVLHGAFWILNSNVFGRALDLARGVILARLLEPDDFGLFGLATVVIGFTTMFSDVDVLYSYGIVGAFVYPVSPNESV
jgi:O-antigen/teichoic acid export membrane protein